MTASPEEIAWAAGFWEGEGSVIAWKHRAKPDAKLYMYLQVTASQKEPEMLERLYVLFGGQRVHRSRNKQQIYRWQATGKVAEDFFKAIWPWLSERRKEQINNKRALVADAPAKLNYVRRVDS